MPLGRLLLSRLRHIQQDALTTLGQGPSAPMVFAPPIFVLPPTFGFGSKEREREAGRLVFLRDVSRDSKNSQHSDEAENSPEHLAYTNPPNRHEAYYCSHITDEETKAHRIGMTSPVTQLREGGGSVS